MSTDPILRERIETAKYGLRGVHTLKTGETLTFTGEAYVIQVLQDSVFTEWIEANATGSSMTGTVPAGVYNGKFLKLTITSGWVRIHKL